MYIKVDANGNPEGFPITYDNVQYLLGVGVDTIPTPEQLAEHNLEAIKQYAAPILIPGGPTPDSHEIVRGAIVRNEDGDIEQLWDMIEFSLTEKIRRWVAGPRLSYLLRTDWTQLPDAPISAEEKAAWAEYRSKLRSITDDIDFNTVKTRLDFEWPTQPGVLDTLDTKWLSPTPPTLPPNP